MRSSRFHPRRAATLVDVGRAAGVSAMAASAVLNRACTSARISEKTRQRIQKAAAKLQYRPNAAARALVNRRMNTLGVAAVIEDGGLNQYFLEVLNGVVEAATRNGENTTVFTLRDWAADASRLPQFCDGRIDGMILVGPLLTRAAARPLPGHTPFVSLHANHHLPSVVNLESDEETGAFEMVRHLTDLGHRRVLHLSGPHGLLGAQRRLRGYRRALAAARIPFDSGLVAEAGFTVAAGRTAFQRWLSAHAAQPLPQAVFCVNDDVAIGCMEALAELGLRVPGDISVAGFDDTMGGRTTVPQLATVRQPLRAMGSQAVDVLLRMVRRHGHEPLPTAGPMVFPVELVLRASIAPPSSESRISEGPGSRSRPVRVASNAGCC
ncbi:MAG: LacI family DNA-binding transcriptional regulator [Opitutaceae bacterium]